MYSQICIIQPVILDCNDQLAHCAIIPLQIGSNVMHEFQIKSVKVYRTSSCFQLSVLFKCFRHLERFWHIDGQQILGQLRKGFRYLRSDQKSVQNRNGLAMMGFSKSYFSKVAGILITIQNSRIILQIILHYLKKKTKIQQDSRYRPCTNKMYAVVRIEIKTLRNPTASTTSTLALNAAFPTQIHCNEFPHRPTRCALQAAKFLTQPRAYKPSLADGTPVNATTRVLALPLPCRGGTGMKGCNH